ncbi:MAG: TetR/AcrR family transcriptional regulator [Cytophagaceae bacterium]|jgi:AcrR family transcriptional regulator|nr:TetR/AcrR family transcriptional regulator [Cytophagaceae bacterium]
MSKEEVYKEILMKSGELFLRFGIKSISMDDISRQLAISKKTIYQYFSDKEELVQEFMKAFLQAEMNQMLELKRESKNVIDELIKSSHFMKQQISNINPTLIYDLKKYHPKAWKCFEEYKWNFLVNEIRETLLEGIKGGYFRKDIDVEILTRMRIEQVEMGFNQDIFNPSKFNMSKVQVEFFEHFLFGISTLKGHKLINKYKEIIEEED